MEEITEKALSDFKDITGCNDANAQFFLEACNGNLQEAIDKYYQEPEAHNTMPIAETSVNTRSSDLTNDEQHHITSPNPSAPDPYNDAFQNPQSSNAQFGHQKSQPKIKGLDDIGESEDDESNSGPEDNEYYAGGEKSGVAVKGGKKPDPVGGLFESAKKHGAVQGSESSLRPESSSINAFQGLARTLDGQQFNSGDFSRSADPITVTITFYTNGIFTVNDGAARRIDDPANADFIKSISKGECPAELNTADGRMITVNLIRKEHDYKEPERPLYRAFEGQGQIIGQNNTNASSTTTLNPIVTGNGEWEGANESLPITSIQIRLIDGTRLVARFNHTHRISDIRRFIAIARPDLPRNCLLTTNFPLKVLDNSATIEDAGLINSVVIQKAV